MGLEPLLDAIKSKDNSSIAGELMMAMEGFDVSGIVCRVYSGSIFLVAIKYLVLAKEQLDFSEFDITARVIKKAEKHWNHYIK
jgi:hypothetical protein